MEEVSAAGCGPAALVITAPVEGHPTVTVTAASYLRRRWRSRTHLAAAAVVVVGLVGLVGASLNTAGAARSPTSMPFGPCFLMWDAPGWGDSYGPGSLSSWLVGYRCPTTPAGNGGGAW